MMRSEKSEKPTELISRNAAEAHSANMRFAQQAFEEAGREASKTFAYSLGRAFEFYFNAFRALSSMPRLYSPREFGPLVSPLQQVPGRAARDVYRAMIKARERADTTPDIETLAKEQGVGPVTDTTTLAADFWPEEESADEFASTVRRWREEDTALSS